MRDIVLIAFPGMQSLDLTGPAEVFAAASKAVADRGTAGYRLHVLTRDGAPLRASSGLAFVPDGRLDEAPAHVDTLLVVGGTGTPQALADDKLIAWIAATAPRARRVASVCSGAFLLAEAGLLRGRRATTHWSACAALAQRYPDVVVDPEPIFVRDGDVWTSAGVTAGMDLALALVEDDHGHDVALAVARRLVLFLRRPANQAQLSAHLAAQSADRRPLRDLQADVVAAPGEEWTVAVMARRAAMSPRHFARAFHAEVGITPARYVEQVRLEAARRRLEESDEPVRRIATTCGFGTDETMRRSFVRALGVSPAEYRRRFASPVMCG